MNSFEQWHLVRLEVAPAAVEIAADWLREIGCEGVQIEDTRIELDESEDAQLVPRERPLVTGYRRGEAEAVAPPFDAQTEVEAVESQNWATQWRENFPPLEIGRFLIVPSWESADAGDKIALELDPGLAFGTGQHPTTRMCLELLGEQVQNGQTLLDVGCGSGILSLAAAKLGAQVVASDLDQWCVDATLENAAKNNVEVETHLAADLNWVEAPFELVVANLMSDLLIRLAPELWRVTQSGGTLIVSGISSPRADEVQAALENIGFTRLDKREQDGETRGDGFTERWSAFVFQKAHG